MPAKAAAWPRTSVRTTTPRPATSPRGVSDHGASALRSRQGHDDAGLRGPGIFSRRGDQRDAGGVPHKGKVRCSPNELRAEPHRGRARCLGNWPRGTPRHPAGGRFLSRLILHPGQLPRALREPATGSSGGLHASGRALAATSSRRRPRPHLVGDVFDDAATGQGLLNYFLRARNCGSDRPARRRADRLDGGRVRPAVVREDPEARWLRWSAPQP